MVDVAWYSFSFVPPQYQIIFRIISGFFMVLGFLLIAPLILLVIYDLLLWVWRLSGIGQRIDNLVQTLPAPTNSSSPPLNGNENGNRPTLNGTNSNGQIPNGHHRNGHSDPKKED